MDVTVPDSPLDVHLRRIQQINSDNNDYQHEQKEESFHKKIMKFAYSFIHSQILPMFVAPWCVVERGFCAISLIPFCIQHDIVSDEETRQLVSKFSLISKQFVALFLIVLLVFPWWLVVAFVFLGVILPSLPFALNCLLYSLALGPYSVALTKTMRRCTNLLTEIHVVNLGFVYASRCRPTTDLLDRIATEQSREAASSLQNSLENCMNEIRSIVNFYFERSSDDMPSSVKTRLLVAGRRSLKYEDFQEPSSTTVKMRKTLSFTSLHLYDLDIAVFRCMFAFLFDNGFLLGRVRLMKIFVKNVYVCLKFRKIVSKLEQASKTAIFADLNNSFSNIEQFSKFMSTTKRTVDDENKNNLDGNLRGFVFQLILLNQKTNNSLIPLIMGDNNESPASPPPVLNELTEGLQNCISLLAHPSETVVGLSVEKPSLKSENNANPQQKKVELENLSDSDDDDDLQLFFADTAEDDASTVAPKSRQNIGDLVAEKTPSVTFLAELRSVLSERTKATRMKEREILRRRGVDIDSIITDADPVKETRRREVQQPVLLDNETRQLRAALVADFKLDVSLRNRFQQQNKTSAEFVLCSSESDSEQLDN